MWMKRYGVGLLVATAAAAALAQDPSFDGQVYYHLSTQFRGPGMRLDVFNGGDWNGFAHLAASGSFSGQFWHLAPAENGAWRLTTMFRGPSQCLDVVNGGDRNNDVHLATCGAYSGQLWTISAQGGAYRLTSAFRGPTMCLDVVNGGPQNNLVHLAPCGNYTGQMWHLQPSETAVTP